MSETARHGPDLASAVTRLAEVVVADDLAAAVSSLVAPLSRCGPAVAVRLDRLTTAYGLSPFERDVLVMIGLPEEHEVLSRAARTTHPRGEPRMSPPALAAALALDDEGRDHLRASLEAGPLRRFGLVQCDRVGPFPENGVRLADGLWAAVRGCDVWPDDVRPLQPAELDLDGVDADRLATLVRTGRSVVLVDGGEQRPASELAAVVANALGAVGLDAVFIDPTHVEPSAMHAVSAHAVVRDQLVVLVGAPTGAPLPDHPGAVVVCTDDAPSVELDDRPAITIELGDRGLAESIGMWDRLVPELNGSAAALASVLRVDHVRAARAVGDARAAARALGQPVSVASIVTHARQRTDAGLPSSVRLVRPDVPWDALVTRQRNDRLLRSIVDRVRGQVRVLHDWGFGSRSPRGVRALFAGPPGTGKTLSAEIVASSLGLDLLVVDLSSLVSKWLGETEKNISEVFAAAERSQAMLFFDEADAIFGKRTDGGDAQSRWANLETAHLLNRIDTFDGLVVLATNLRANIDEAFVRRLDVIAEFEEPGVDERRRLWTGHLPPEAPVSPDVDVDELATLYPITGGLIRNAVLTAAFDAATNDGPIDQRSLFAAIEQEYDKSGRSFPGIPWRAAASDPNSTRTDPLDSTPMPSMSTTRS